MVGWGQVSGCVCAWVNVLGEGGGGAPCVCRGQRVCNTKIMVLKVGRPLTLIYSCLISGKMSSAWFLV